uniref:Uncharacterized protein n=1 Tax=Moniliophthora roreri TaxID=221103 RepID=A0A0W0G1A2_MONRR
MGMGMSEENVGVGLDQA